MKKKFSYDEHAEEIAILLATGLSKTEVAEEMIKRHGYTIQVDSIRRAISKNSNHPSLDAYCEENGIDRSSVSSYWHKGEGFSVNVKVGDESKSWEEQKREFLEDFAQFKPKFKLPKHKKDRDAGHCLVIDPADIHIGKLCRSFETGCDYDSQVAVQRVKEGVGGILQKASGFDITQIVFIAGNDVLHIDTPRRTTTSGTPQDTDGMWWENYKIAQKLYIEIIGALLKVAPVHFVFNPSNHDFMSGFMLCDAVAMYYGACDDFTSDVSMIHRKYYRFGQNLIGTTHGDGAKQADLPLLMATEAPEMWAAAKHRYVYIHHVHHKSSKDYQGVTVESLRSPSGTDAWHHRNGYQHAPKAIEGFIHHPNHGQIARLTHLF